MGRRERGGCAPDNSLLWWKKGAQRGGCRHRGHGSGDVLPGKHRAQTRHNGDDPGGLIRHCG